MEANPSRPWCHPDRVRVTPSGVEGRIAALPVGVTPSGVEGRIGRVTLSLSKGARAVILAAGTSSRYGAQKLLADFRGRPMIEYPIAAAQAWNPIVVCDPEVEQYLLGRASCPSTPLRVTLGSDIELVRNDEPALGMSHSLALANRVVAAELNLIVLLGDKPLVSKSLIESLCTVAEDNDVVYPVREGVPGHPVVLSPRARRSIAGLPTGDTLRLLRDRPELRQCGIQTADLGATFDVDTIADVTLFGTDDRTF